MDQGFQNRPAQSKKRKAESTPSPLAIKRLKLLDSRKQLPIWNRANDIRQLLETHAVLVLSGETGSGKSTQIPQFLLDSSWCSSKIAVTQPRRVAAISLARRVAEEMGSPLGSSSPASKVGYSVRFDDNTSPGNRIKFLTEGMLLQELLRDPHLKQYSCVIVDEVHERSINVDLILGFLKKLLSSSSRKSHLKVVVMSATADVDHLSAFFAEKTAPSIQLSPSSIEVANSGDYEASNLQGNGFPSSSTSHEISVTTCHIKGRQYPVQVRYLATPTEDVLDASLQRIFQIHCKEPMPGDILVFLTGQETIQSLQKLVEEFAENLTSEFPKLLVLPLFAALPQTAQQRIFERPPPNARKVILSTNIAETSVTVPGVRYVIDSGKAKVRQFRSRIGLDSLLIKPISRSSAEQRKGRAGREAPGQCHRMFTETAYQHLEKDNIPEIQRCDLSSALLIIKARGVEDVLRFSFLTPPSREAMEKALLQLYHLGALEDDGRISDVGRNIAKLPLTPSLGRVIVEAANPHRDCLLEVIDIVACLSVESIFLAADSEEAREKASEARSALFKRQGDHLTLLAAVQAYAAENTDRKRWANDHMISHRAMQSVMDVRKQLTAQCKQHLNSVSTVRASVDDAIQENILKCFLQGFSTNIARLCPDKSYKTLVGNQTVAIHPSSVLFGRKVEAILYNEYVYTNKAYARGVSAIQLNWLQEVLGSS